MRKHEELEEVWKPIPGYPRYEISSKGRIKSFTSSKYPEGKMLKPHRKKNGYIVVTLSTGNERENSNERHLKHLHRLLAEAFIPIPEELQNIPTEKLVVDHILPVSNSGGLFNEDGSYNLRWCTVAQNCNNPLTVENQKAATELKRKKKVYQYDENLNLIATYPSTADCSRELNKSQGNIASCCDGALKRYLGYIFSYEELTSMEQRERLEKEKEYQRERNYKSTIEAGKRYYQRNAEKVREMCKIASKKYYRANTDKIRERMKVYYQKYKQRREEQNGRRQRQIPISEGLLPTQ